MSTILDQLGLNSTFFIQLATFILVFVIVGNGFFKPALKLIQARHAATVKAREDAERTLAQAQAKFEEYRARIQSERNLARKDYDEVLTETKREEAEILSRARAEAQQITQTTFDEINHARARVKAELESDVERMAQQISETLLKGSKG